MINEKILIQKLRDIKKDIMQNKNWEKKVLDRDGLSHFLDLLIEHINSLVGKGVDYCVICGKPIEDYTYVEYDTMVCSRECSCKLDDMWRGK